MVSASTSGGAAAQALRALRRAAQLHTEHRASATKPAKLDAARTRGRGRAMLGSSQPDPVPCSQPSATQPLSQLPSSQLPSSQLPSSQLPSSQLHSSQLPLSQADTLAGDKCGSQRDPRDVLASMSTQTPLSNVPPSSLDTLPASQAAMPEAVPAKQAPLRAAQAPAAFQAPQSGVAEAAAALAAALATFAGSGASQEVVRRRYRCKAPPPGPSTPPSSIRRRSPSSTQRKRKPVRKVKSRAEVIKEVCSKTIWASVSRLSEEVRKMEKERAAHRTRCQKAVTEALRLLNDHQKACKESSEAFAGTAKAADAALAAVAALERSQGAEHSRLPVPTNSLRASMAGHSVLPPPGQLKKRAAFIFFTERKEQGRPMPFCAMVLGAGRGPLVEATLKAAERAEVQIELYAVEKNPNAVHALRHRKRRDGWTSVQVVPGDMRSWTAPKKADVIISELLGSFGDNELSPECLDGAQRFLADDGVCIPTSYTAALTPVSAPLLWANARQGAAGGGVADLETAYVVHLQHAFYPCRAIKDCFEFHHPKSDGSSNDRSADLDFEIEVDSLVHGFAGYFDCVLYGSERISIHPETFSVGMFSWFPMFFPLRYPQYLRKGSIIRSHWWRRHDAHKVWYEWALSEPAPTEVQNPGGRSWPIGLL